MKIAFLPLLAAMAATGCASAPPKQANVAQPRGCVTTGSRIPQDQNPCATFGRSYTAEELQQTGHIDMARALRTLDPAIQ